ncbi:MAG: S41 family peptidase [Prevotellaceae bacterium]|nr:S41 family peptidase [Prevotellaceae bacterium]
MKKTLLCMATLLTLWFAPSIANKKNHNFEVSKNLQIFNEIFKNLDLMYVDTLNPSQAIGDAINGMLEALDPYTVYYPADKDKDLKMMITGKYAGIGSVVRYNRQLKRVIIEEPYENMPAAEVGLKKGDIILSIDDSVMTSKNVTDVSERLRGDAGSTFVLKVKRPSTGKTMSFKITRRNIKVPAIPYYGVINDSIGYICLTSFTEGCAKEMRRTFVDLKNRGIKSLMLDLRGNGGGSLSEAVDIINMWVPRGVTLVETKGKLSQSNRKYKTRYEPIDTVMPLAVLVDGETASASEITSGSIQDLDRGVVIGVRTYGKGLVQVPIDLPYGSSLKVTTSKYYIPSGRCIQAYNYKHSNGGYTEHIADSLTSVFNTRNGREVRDGGGIKPDIESRPDTLPNIAVYLNSLDTTEVMLNYVIDYIATHPTIAPASQFKLSDADYDDFKSRVLASGFTYDNMSGKTLDELEKYAKFEGYYDDAKETIDLLRSKFKHNLSADLDRHRSVICHLIERNIITAYYYQAGGIEASIGYDKTIDKAIETLKDQAGYKAILHRK